MAIMIKKNKQASESMKGSVTVEAAIVLPIFLYAALCLICILKVEQMKVKLRMVTDCVIREFAEHESKLEKMNKEAVKKAILRYMGEEISDKYFEDKRNRFTITSVEVSGGRGDIFFSWLYKFEFPLFYKNVIVIKDSIKIRSWNDLKNEGAEQMVYITENGKVFHKSIGCAYLSLSIKKICQKDINKYRNRDGGKYYKCKSCSKREGDGGVYITDNGRFFHSNQQCAGLKRSIIKVSQDDLFEMKGCSKCWK